MHSPSLGILACPTTVGICREVDESSPVLCSIEELLLWDEVSAFSGRKLSLFTNASRNKRSAGSVPPAEGGLESVNC